MNEGITAICKVFFSSAEKYEKEQLLVLAESCREFLSACKEAIQLNEELIPADDQAQLEFHSQLKQGYAEIAEEVGRYLLPFEREVAGEELDDSEDTDTVSESVDELSFTDSSTPILPRIRSHTDTPAVRLSHQ